MKTQPSVSFPFAPGAAQTRGDAAVLRKKNPQNKNKNSMHKFNAILLLGLLAATATPRLQGQIVETHTFTTNRVVPDGNASGLQDVRSVTSAIRQISLLKVRLKITGEFNGDLYGYVRHSSGFSILLNRPGKTASNAAGYDDSGLDITLAASGAAGDLHTYRSVVSPASGAPLSGTWEPDARTADPAVVVDTSPRSALLASFNGLDAGGEWTLYLADLESGGTNMLTQWGLEITGASSPTIAWSTPAPVTYGAALAAAQLNATVTYNSTNVNGTLSYTPAAGTVLNAGAAQILSVTFTPADTTSFLPASTTVSVDVLKAPLTVTADDKSKVYGAALPVLSVHYSGFVNSDGLSQLTSLATAITGATAGSDVGTYPITASGVVSSNYVVTYIAGSLTVTQALTVGAITSSANPALPGANVTFTMTVTAQAPGVGIPVGSVNFRIDGSIAGSGALTGGAASFGSTSLALGSHLVVAEYAGNGNFVGSTNTLTPNQVINTPPIAGADMIERYPTQGVKVRLATLLANDNDADGDTLVITVSTTSAHGGTITVTDNWVSYTPASGFTSVDSFTYTIADGRGAVVTGTVTVNIKTDIDPGQNLTVSDLGDGRFRIRGSGIPGRTYRLQYTGTLTPVDWQILPGASVVADASGVFEFVDTSGSSSRYYRSVYP
ncbi:MAG: hypothetical protein QOF48_1289 [Verrucomicrobiota bacterium]|jgi:subtilisin-like proprotein convertase family protein